MALVRIKQLVFSWLLVAGVNVLGVLLLSEVALRIIGYSHPTFYAYDSQRGWALKPEARGLWTDEGSNWVEINADGMHDREHSLKRPPNSYRIAVLGDSFTEAIQLPLNQNFSSVAEEALKTCPLMVNHAPEVINFGVAGYGTAQELLTLRHQVWKYSPELVVLAFFIGNDLEDNDPKLPSDHALARYRPYFVVQSNKLELVKPWGNSPLLPAIIWLSAHSRTFQVLNRVRQRYFAGRRWDRRVSLNVLLSRWQSTRASAPMPSNQRYAAATPLYSCHGGGLPLPSLDPVMNPELNRAWDTTERLVLETRDEVRARDANFLLMIIGPDIENHPDEATRVRFMKNCKIEDLAYGETRLANFARSHKIDTLLLSPAFQAYAREHHAFLYGFGSGKDQGFGHWNANGHWLAGQLLARQICLMQSPSVATEHRSRAPLNDKRGTKKIAETSD